MKFYLFTDSNVLLDQNSKGFGEITDFGTNAQKFQITSIHNCQNGSKAYAISDGFLIVQQHQGNPDLVNILLKPTEQPLDSIPIEYFIYRGIKKSSIFNNSLVKTSGNDLCNLVHNIITKLNQKYPLITHTPEEYVLAYGAVADLNFTATVLPPGQVPGNIFVDSILNTKGMDYKPFKIKGGASIGELNTEFGMEVVLAKARVKLSDVRKADNYIISDKMDGLTGEDLMNNRDEKEKILGYSDICQFYSEAYSKDSIWAKTSADTAFSRIRQSNAISGIISKFDNKSRVTIDLRNEFNNSINYQDNIAGTIGIKKDGGSTNYIPYPDWPLLFVDGASVSNVYMRVPKSDFVNVRAYYRENSKNSYSFKAINFDSSQYSTELRIKTHKTPSGTVIPSYNYLMLLKETDQDTYPTEWVIKPQHFVDTVFDIEDLVYTDSSENLHFYGLTHFQKATKWKIHDENKFIYLSKSSFMAKLGVAEDVNNVYFFAYANGNSLQTGAKDIAIVSSESDKANFFKDILSAKLNNTLSLTAYKTSQAGQDTFVIRDNINSYGVRDIPKAIQNKNNFTLVGLDKQESLGKLKTAYLQFANQHPKRLTLRNVQEITEAGGRKHWQAEIYIIGYGNDTSTNSYKVRAVATGIMLVYSRKDQRVFGTSKFNQSYFKTALKLNAENFYGKMYKHIRYNFRNVPDFAPNSVVKFQGGRRDIFFKVLGKCQSSEGITWYFIELLNEELDFTDPHKKGLKGSRYFISKEAYPVITATFTSFLDELEKQDRSFDLSTGGPQNDTVEQRITRYRQRGHDSNVDLFNKVIGTGADLPSPQYLDQIPYQTDELIAIPAETGTDNAAVGFTVTNRLQLYRDFEVVEFSNGKSAEIQHMFVGLDVIGRLMTNFTISYYLETINVLNNVHFSLHAGDAGSVPNVVYDAIIDDPETDGLATIREAIVLLFSRDTPNNRKLHPLNGRFYRHFLDTRFALHDRYANIYSFGLYYQLFRTAWVFEIPDPSTSLQIEALFSGFNDNMEGAEADSVRYFFDFFNAQPDKDISSTSNAALYNDLRLNTFEFSKIWRKKEEGGEIIDDTEASYLMVYSYLAIQEYIELINTMRQKYLNS